MKVNLEDILKLTEANRREIVELLQKLVQIPTIVPPGENYDVIARVVGDKMDEVGLKTKLIEVPKSYFEREKRKNPDLTGPRVNVLGIYKGFRRAPKLVVNGHLDTVPVGKGWTVDPFKAELKHGKIYGRGATDNKAGITAIIMAFKILKDMGFRLAGDVIVCATVDEEIGGVAGLNYLIERDLIKGDYGLSVDGRINQVHVALNGRIAWKILTYGKAAHSSMAHLGINAIEKMAKIVLAIQEYSKDLQHRDTNIPAHPETGKRFVTPMANVGTIQGGIKDNIVPNRCMISVDRRITPEETLDAVRSEFKRVIEETSASDPHVSFQIEEEFIRAPCAIPIDHPLALKLKNAADKILAEKPLICGSFATSDMAYLINMAQIPSCALGPGRIENNIHCPNEYMPISDLVDLTKIYVIALIDILGPHQGVFH